MMSHRPRQRNLGHGGDSRDNVRRASRPPFLRLQLFPVRY